MSGVEWSGGEGKKGEARKMGGSIIGVVVIVAFLFGRDEACIASAVGYLYLCRPCWLVVNSHVFDVRFLEVEKSRWCRRECDRV